MPITATKAELEFPGFVVAGSVHNQTVRHVGNYFRLTSSQVKPTKLARRRSPLPGRRGLSLLEVVLAVAILSMSAALLAQVIQTGTDNAIAARDSLEATLLCEAKIAEVAVGAIPMQSGNWVAITDQVAPTQQWYYRMDAVPSNIPNMFLVTMYVGNDLTVNSGSRPLATMTKMFIDPALQMDVPPDAAESGNSTTEIGL